MGNRILIRLVLLFLVLYVYTFVRYHFGKDVPMDEWLLILNKSISWFALTLLAFSALPVIFLTKYRFDRRFFGIVGYYFAILHVSIASILLLHDKYPKILRELNFTNQGALFLLIGMTAFFVLFVPFQASIKKLSNSSRAFKFGKIGVAIIAFHPLVLGYENWIKVNNWPYFLPPITLLSFLTVLAVFFIRYSYRERA